LRNVNLHAQTRDIPLALVSSPVFWSYLSNRWQTPTVAVRLEKTAAPLDAASPANPAVRRSIALIKETPVVHLALALLGGIAVESEHAIPKEESAARMGIIAKPETTASWWEGYTAVARIRIAPPMCRMVWLRLPLDLDYLVLLEQSLRQA
jgi:hypothetical protein